MLWLDSVSCHHGDHGEPGSWISANKLVCRLISQSSEPITCEPASMESQQHLKKGFQQHLTKVRLPKKQNLSPSCIRHACIVVSSLMSNSMYCATSIQKPFVHIDSERIVQSKWYNQMEGFVLRLPPHKVAHATLTQPFQCDPQPEIQETHRTTQTNTTTRCRTQRRNQFAHETTPAAPAAHTRYLASSAAATFHGKTQGFVLRLPPHKVAHATLTQPFQCDPQPKIQETHRTTQTDTTTRCKTHRRNQFAHETTPAAPVAQTRYLSSSAAATLHGKTQGLVLRLPPQNIAHATFMQPLQCVSQHPVANPHLSSPIYARGNIK